MATQTKSVEPQDTPDVVYALLEGLDPFEIQVGRGRKAKPITLTRWTRMVHSGPGKFLIVAGNNTGQEIEVSWGQRSIMRPVDIFAPTFGSQFINKNDNQCRTFDTRDRWIYLPEHCVFACIYGPNFGCWVEEDEDVTDGVLTKVRRR